MTDKPGMRSRIQAARTAMPNDEREAARLAIRDHVLSYCASELASDAWVAGYQPTRTEPGSVELLAALADRGHRVLVPLTLPDRDLDWTAWDEPSSRSAQPAAQPLGMAAIARVALILVPAYAVDRSGHRLGRGGGSYDRALARVRPGTPVAALLFAEELVETVPVDEWDLPVTAAVTPAGWIQLTPTGLRNSG
ncbi:MAG TPA: 5-formyltetrahydrofolate cyclo-ligase [Jatrophihabitans sp.]|nr:5-formyltetrahydrofolate cyclo-ligase [Jatrophihabitans sp.]